MEWLRKNATPLSAVASLMASVVSLVVSVSVGVWTVFTYFHPAPAAVVEPRDDRNRGPVSHTDDNPNEPRERPEEPFNPKIRLLVYGAPVVDLPRSVERSLEAASAIVQRTPEQQGEVDDDLLRLLTSLGYLLPTGANAVIWQDWNTLAVVPVAKEPVARPQIPTLQPPPAPQTFEPRTSKPSSGEQL